MQTDRKMQNNNYIKFNVMVVYSRGRNSRVWDLKESNIIKKAVNNDKDTGIRREIVMTLDFNEAIRRYNHINSRKINKNDHLFINILPYMEFTAKYEIDKKGNLRTFKPHRPEALYWLRIFCNEEIYLTELNPPFECKVKGAWGNEEFSGGPRFVLKNKQWVENPHWPLNPQYMIKFNGNNKCKIILKKVSGHMAHEETKVGLLVTKPTYYEENKEKLEKQKIEKHQAIQNREYLKMEGIERCLKSTSKILVAREFKPEEIYPKLSLNESELVFESSYNNKYCASIQTYFSRLDSPLILIPTFEN